MTSKVKLKIAVFHLAFVYSGGGEKLVLKEVQMLRDSGHEVDLFVPVIKQDKSFPELIKKQKIFSFLPQLTFGSWQYESFQIIVTCILAPLFAYKFKKYDVIFAANQPSLWIAYVINRLYKVPYVSYLAQPTRFLFPRAIDKETGLFFTKKESASYSVKLMKMFKSFVRFADAVSIRKSSIILANGMYMANRLSQVYGIKNVRSVAAGADCNKRPLRVGIKRKGQISFKGIKLVKPYILMTNRHFSQKRFEHGVVAFSSILGKHPEFRLVITGQETQYSEEIKLLADRLGILPRITFTGYVSEKMLSIIYKNAYCYLYTAPEEDFGMGVIEAMGYGTPVVAWDNAGPSFTIVNKRTGFLAKPFDIGDYSAKLESLISTPNLCKSISRRACVHVRKNYSWNSHLKGIEDALAAAAIKRD